MVGRRRRWLSKDHFKGKKLPKTWKWEKEDPCEECGHDRGPRYKVYASWYIAPTPTEIDKMMKAAMKSYAAYMDKMLYEKGTGYLSGVTVPDGY